MVSVMESLAWDCAVQSQKKEHEMGKEGGLWKLSYGVGRLPAGGGI
jgi:hypothetical protein